MIEAFATALGVVFLAELGDKSQLLTLTFAARYRARPVLLGLVFATAVLMAISVTVGAVAGEVLPDRPVEIGAGLVFLAFAAWTLRDEDDDDEELDDAATDGRSPTLTVAVAFGLAELGDKTMLAAVTLASTLPAVGVWGGATVGMVAANALALLVGDRLARSVPEVWVRRTAAALFAVFGVLLLAGVG